MILYRVPSELLLQLIFTVFMRPFCTKVRPFEILKFGMGKHLVLFFERKFLRPNFYGNHWRGWV